jgi:hypothetical protein
MAPVGGVWTIGQYRRATGANDSRKPLARGLLYRGPEGQSLLDHIKDFQTMTASTFEFAARAAQAPRRARKDRRTRGRLRELCDEVLASYRLAQGQDSVTDEDRELANQVLRGITPIAK